MDEMGLMRAESGLVISPIRSRSRWVGWINICGVAWCGVASLEGGQRLRGSWGSAMAWWGRLCDVSTENGWPGESGKRIYVSLRTRMMNTWLITISTYKCMCFSFCFSKQNYVSVKYVFQLLRQVRYCGDVDDTMGSVSIKVMLLYAYLILSVQAQKKLTIRI